MTLSALLPFAKIFAVFAAMLIGIRVRIGLGNSIMAGAVTMGLVFLMAPGDWMHSVLIGVTSQKTLMLAAVVGLILLLSDLLEKTGQSQRLMDALTAYLKNPRLRLFFFPALIGFLPMPGGAVFSAPMVKSAASGMDVGDVDKTLINYWFRHIWEPCWPMYPGLLLAASLVNVPIMELAAMGIPSTLFWTLLGWIFFLRPGVLPLGRINEAEQAATGDTKGALYALVQSMPLVIAITGAVGLELIIAVTNAPIPFEIGVIAALLLSVLCAIAQNKGSVAIAAKCMARPHLYKMLYVVAAIFVFKEVLQGAGAIDELASAAGGSAALITCALLLPFLTGMVGGIAIAFIGASFPLLFGLLDTLGMGDQKFAYTMLALFSGYAGVMASPLHICFILTCQYFRTGLAAPLKRLALPCAGLTLWGVAYWWVLL